MSNLKDGVYITMNGMRVDRYTRKEQNPLVNLYIGRLAYLKRRGLLGDDVYSLAGRDLVAFAKIDPRLPILAPNLEKDDAVCKLGWRVK